MELGQYQIQIFVSLVVILGAAFVALICDFLKGNNEQLRELTIELKVRREEEQRRSQMMTGHTISTSTPALKERMRMERVEKERLEQRIEAPETRVAPLTRAMAAPAEKEKHRKRPPSADALAAMERGAQLASSPRRRPAAQPREAEVVAPEIQPAEVFQQMTPTFEQTAPMVAETAAAEQTIVIPAQAASQVTQSQISQSQITMVAKSNGPAKKDWGSLLARKSKTMEQTNTNKHAVQVEVRQDLLDAVVAATATTNAQSAASAAVPAGFHEGYILSRLVQSRQPVSGLIVSIGVNTPRNPDGSMPEPVRQLMQSLIGAGDFACQSSSEEFLLIYPNERGASAQRRLSEIAQQLWDFQLRSMGSFSILFSWGGVEVRSESIDEAIASANERMHETRRSRKLLTMEPRVEQQQHLAQAV
jgi:hypothetical protein